MRIRTAERFVSVVVGVVLALSVATGCDPESTPLQRSTALNVDGACEVGIVGDSLVVGARDIGRLTQVLASRGCAVTAVDARTGRSTAEGANVVDAWAALGALPRVLVVGLGTNDCNAAAFEAQVRRILARVGPDRPVVWVNSWRPGCDTALNDVLFAVQAELGARSDGGNLWILNHWQWIYENPGLLARDRVHLNADGYRAHAQRIADKVTG